MLYCLTYINDPNLSSVVKHVVFTEITMHKAALVVHSAHDKQYIGISLLNILNFGILEPRCTQTFLSNKFHDNNVIFEEIGLGSFNEPLCHIQSFEISYLFLGPQLHHLTRVALAVTPSKSEFSTDIPFSILENKNRGLENFDRELELLILSHQFHCV